MRTLVLLGATASLVVLAAVSCGGSSSETVCDPTVTACDDTGGTGGDGGGGDSVVTDATVDVEVGTPGSLPPGSTVLPDGAIVLPDGAIVGPDAIVGCVPGSTQCTNCKDDDGDGLVDWMDPDCTGPLDNDESSFATGIPGDNIDPCKQDCWFDGNSGSGDDGCLFDLRCYPGYKDPKCPYDAKMAADPKKCPPPTTKCIEKCKPLTPKGCDCAGCCDVYDAAGTVHTVKLVSTCTSASLSDPTKCPVCTKIADCSNPCGKCDVCLGKLTLPPECFPKPDAGPDAPPDATTDTTPPPPPSGCPEGFPACSVSTPCPAGSYCLTGCCIKAPT